VIEFVFRNEEGKVYVSDFPFNPKVTPDGFYLYNAWPTIGLPPETSNAIRARCNAEGILMISGREALARNRL
jgi:hypothetical protein